MKGIYMIYMKKFETTREIAVPKRLIDQVIGQDKAVRLVKKAAKQRRNVLLLGPPGIGKSMLAQGMAELMPAEQLEDVLIYPNPRDENRPLVRRVKTYPSKKEIESDQGLRVLYARTEQPVPPAKEGVKEKIPPSEFGQGRRIVQKGKMTASISTKGVSPALLFLFLVMGLIIFLYATDFFSEGNEWFAIAAENKWFVLAVVFGILGIILLWRFTSQIGRRMGVMATGIAEPKLIIDNSGKKTAPFVDATGAKAGALLGDVRHDPLQTGGLGTPAHVRVESGAIHRANKGVLFIDEVASLKPEWQQALLTAMQEKRYSITGQSELSSGALVKTDPVPCDFVLVAAGNVGATRSMHPALRSRIRGNGYEIYVEGSMPDNPKNENRIVQFIAQEIKKDGKIPHFKREAVIEIIGEARRKAGRKKRLTLNLRELGGLVRAAGDIAMERKAGYVTREHVLEAKGVARTLEEQISQHYIEAKKDYEVFLTKGHLVGKVNGLAVMGDGSSGLVLPIVAEAAPASSKSEGKLIATGKLGEIAKEAVENVSAIIKKYIGKDISQYDFHVQFLQTYEGIEGDSAAVSVAVAIISALGNIPVKQDYALTGSLTVRGSVLPVGGVTPKAEAAIGAGIRHMIVPKANSGDIYLSRNMKKRIRIHPVSNIIEVLKYSLKECREKRALIKKMKGMLKGKK